MTLDARRTGEALAAAAPDLARLWRSMCAAERPDLFPGLLDGLVDSFLALAADALAGGSDPALVPPSLAGIVRVDARDPHGTRDELDREWDLVEHVLQAACRALDADDAARAWLSRAVALTRGSAPPAAGGEGAPAILTVRLFPGPAVTRRARAPSRR